MAEVADWVVDEMATLDLGHKRRDDRVKGVLSALAAGPTASIPTACQGVRAEVVGAYRLFENDAVEFQGVLAPHCQKSLERVREQPVVVLAQDTTEIDLTRPRQQVRGAGPLDDGPRRGCFVHPLMAFTPTGLPLGSVNVDCWTRGTRAAPLDAAARRRQRQELPIEDKESARWVEGLEQAHRVAAAAGSTEVISVADSEADIYELFVAGQPAAGRAQFVVRACQDRAIEWTTDEEHPAKRLRDAVARASAALRYEVRVRGRQAKLKCDQRGRRQPRESRTTEVEVRATTVTLRPPRRTGHRLPPVSMNVVWVREVQPPADDEPIDWLLLTSLQISTADELLRVIQTYTVRWTIEVFFRVLKQGCRVEERLFEAFDRVERFLAIALIVAWRTLYVSRLGRDFPDIDCEAVFETSEWKAVYQFLHKTPPPDRPPTLKDMVRMVAQLGGYINRPRDDEPGTETIWKGLQRLHDLARCWDLFGPAGKS
jgi:hypothetical protein